MTLSLSFKLFFHDTPFSEFYYPTYGRAELPGDSRTTESHQLNRRYVEELGEDIEELVTALENLSIEVHRPLPLTSPIPFQTPYWNSTCVPALNVRDRVIILGDEIIETPPQVRARYFETDLLKPIFYEYFGSGAKWTLMPYPIMTDRSFDTSYVSGQRTPALEEIKDLRSRPTMSALR